MKILNGVIYIIFGKIVRYFMRGVDGWGGWVEGREGVGGKVSGRAVVRM